MFLPGDNGTSAGIPSCDGPASKALLSFDSFLQHTSLPQSCLCAALGRVQPDISQAQEATTRLIKDATRGSDLMNLMLNGNNAMRDMNTQGQHMITSRQEENGQLLVSVADTGVGLQTEQVEKIFNAFFTSKPQGTCMGLPINRSIIESHGGRL